MEEQEQQQKQEQKQERKKVGCGCKKRQEWLVKQARSLAQRLGVLEQSFDELLAEKQKEAAQLGKPTTNPPKRFVRPESK